MNEIYGNMEFAYNGKDITYVLSVGINERNEMYMPSLSFYKDYGHNDEKMIELWDDDTYLIETLLEKVLVPWEDNKRIEEAEQFAELLKVKGVSLEDFSSIKRLIENCIDNGFFGEYYIKKENGTNIN